MPYVLYITSALGGIALFMMMPRRGYCPAKLGALLGAAALGGLWLYLAKHYWPAPGTSGLAAPVMIYYYIFSALAIGAAARVITHTKPVYAALWFVMVVLASAGLFLLLSAEFMAFAMVIIYGGAILVTYVFVIMLASHETEQTPEFERVAREPAAAVVAGFLLLAVLVDLALPTSSQQWLAPNQKAQAPSDAEIIATELLHRPSRHPVRQPGGADVTYVAVGRSGLDNAERIGLDLFRMHPLGLELAGVILLVALVGAVVIARTRVESPQPPD